MIARLKYSIYTLFVLLSSAPNITLTLIFQILAYICCHLSTIDRMKIILTTLLPRMDHCSSLLKSIPIDCL